MSISLANCANNHTTTETVIERVSLALRRAFGGRHYAARDLADTINRDQRAVRAWINGECAPSLAAAIDIAAQCDEFANEINKLIEERRRQCSPS